MKYNNLNHEKEVIISSEENYATVSKSFKDSNLKKIVINNEKVRPLQELGLNINLSWIWTYILLSLAFSFGLRKVLKIS